MTATFCIVNSLPSIIRCWPEVEDITCQVRRLTGQVRRMTCQVRRMTCQVRRMTGQVRRMTCQVRRMALSSTDNDLSSGLRRMTCQVRRMNLSSTYGINDFVQHAEMTCQALTWRMRCVLVVFGWILCVIDWLFCSPITIVDRVSFLCRRPIVNTDTHPVSQSQSVSRLSCPASIAW